MKSKNEIKINQLLRLAELCDNSQIQQKQRYMKLAETLIVSGLDESETKSFPAEDELRLRLDFEAPESEWKWMQSAKLKRLPEFSNIAQYDAAAIGKALAKIAEDYPAIRRSKRNGIWKWFVPPIIRERVM